MNLPNYLNPDGSPDVNRLFEDHDPALEPWGSMSRDGVRLAMDLAVADGDTNRWFWLEQYLLDTMSTEELQTHNRAQKLAVFLADLFEVQAPGQMVYLAEVAGSVCKMISDELPKRTENPNASS
jgi:hypothetical protein